MKNVFTTSVPARPKNLPTMNSHRRTGPRKNGVKCALLDFFRDQADADEDRDHDAEQRDRRQPEIDDDQAFDLDGDLTDEDGRAGQQQRERNQVVEDAVANRFAECVRGDMEIRALMRSSQPVVWECCSFSTK